MEVKKLIDEVLSDFVSLSEVYRSLHTHPELSFEEFGTAEYIATVLRNEGIEIEPIAGTGVIAKVCGGKTIENPNSAVVLRADIDALPIMEKVGDFESFGASCCSVNEGVMHACGHDLHTAILIGALIILNRHRQEFGGTVIGLFQPAEELNPGGASLVLKEKPFVNYDIKAFVAEHVEPNLQTGFFGFRSGKYMASCDELRFTIKGVGGHAALRDKIKDPIAATAKLIDTLYQIPLLSGDKSVPTIISIGKIEAVGATNVVPDSAYLEGTMRCFDEGWREEIKILIHERAAKVAKECDVEIVVDISEGYPSVVNDEALTNFARSVAAEIFGKEMVVDLDFRPTADDFGFYTQLYPSVYYRLGVGYVKEQFDEGRAGNLHTADFCPDTKAIGFGVTLFVRLATQILK